MRVLRVCSLTMERRVIYDLNHAHGAHYSWLTQHNATSLSTYVPVIGCMALGRANTILVWLTDNVTHVITGLQPTHQTNTSVSVSDWFTLGTLVVHHRHINGSPLAH